MPVITGITGTIMFGWLRQWTKLLKYHLKTCCFRFQSVGMRSSVPGMEMIICVFRQGRNDTGITMLCFILRRKDRRMEHNSSKTYNIGLLMGVFDLFHVGHLRLIRRAKEECSYLRVGVLSDELVLKFKNKLPVIPLSERIEILSAIREVDEVVAITDDPSRLLEWDRRPFDCFFSGDDYSGNSYWEWERIRYHLLSLYQRTKHYKDQRNNRQLNKYNNNSPSPAIESKIWTVILYSNSWES